MAAEVSGAVFFNAVVVALGPVALVAALVAALAVALAPFFLTILVNFLWELWWFGRGDGKAQQL
jgi:hypothetical protein